MDVDEQIECLNRALRLQHRSVLQYSLVAGSPHSPKTRPGRILGTIGVWAPGSRIPNAHAPVTSGRSGAPALERRHRVGRRGVHAGVDD